MAPRLADHFARLTVALAGRYALERELGSGGMATVYLADDLKHRRKVAVKVLRPEIAASLGSERFFREIEVAARLQHPHILPLLDSGEGDGFYYYVMPYIAGESLRDRLAREGELPVHDAVKILSEVVDALAAAHAEGVVHRDIKPDNVMLSGRHALVTDFGIAKAVSEATGREQLTTAGVALGTPSYMAPEQAVADPHLDHRVDIYAVGVLGYEMLTGSPPFTGRSPQEILAAHVTQGPRPVQEVRPAVPAVLAAVLMKCLEKRPADRWKTAEELLSQIEVLATPTAGVTPTTTRPLAAVTPARQFPRWAAWMVGGAIVAAGALALSMRQRSPDTIVLGKRTAVAVGPEWELWPTLSPDGRMVAYMRSDTVSSEIVLQQVDGGAPVTVTASVRGDNVFQALSPDGSRILFMGEEGFYVMPILGGQARLIVSGRLPELLWGSWAPDGERIVYIIRDTLVVQLEDGTGRAALATGQDLHSPAWSADGDWIAYVEGNSRFHANGNRASSQLMLVRATGGTPVAVTDAASHNTSPIWIPGRRALLFVSDREGGRDIYQQALKASGSPQGPAVRISTGLNPERISLSADGRRLAWSVFTQTSNVWSIAIPTGDSVPFSRARQVTSGAQNVEMAFVSRDGAWLYYDSDRSGNFDIWRVPLTGGQPEQITSDPADDFAPAVSPDGRTVAFHSLRSGPGNRDVFVMPAGGGPATRVSTSPGDDRTPLWSPDGQTLSWLDAVTPDSGLLVSRRNDSGSWSAPVRFLAYGGPWKPDGSGLAVYDSVGLRLLNPSTGQRSLLLPYSIAEPLSLFAWSGDGRTLYAPIMDSLGRVRIQSFSLPGGQVKTLVYSDNPLIQGYRYGFDLQGGRFYIPLVDGKLDVWVGEVQIH